MSALTVSVIHTSVFGLNTKSGSQCTDMCEHGLVRQNLINTINQVNIEKL